MIVNPFAVVTPEEMTASEAGQLFVEMHSDFPEVIREGNTFLFGARGSGKSMLIRCSMPDVMMEREQLTFDQLPYFATMLSVKKTSLNLSDLGKLDDLHIPYSINEHFMASYIAMQAFLSLSKIKFPEGTFIVDEYKSFFKNTFCRYLETSGSSTKVKVSYLSQNHFFESLYEHLSKLTDKFITYLKTINLNKDSVVNYTLPLFSYSRFVVPIFMKMISLPGFPKLKPILIFIDDADNLSKVQTEILNSWVASRYQPNISLKVSSQIRLYKTYLTSTGILIESPHDYQEINTSFLYTTKNAKRNYYDKAMKILLKRLQLQGIYHNVDIENTSEVENALISYFPEYQKQKEGIKAEEEKIIKGYKDRGRGSRLNDDIRRYAIPNYIRALGGTRKSRSTFQYAGIDNIIHLSSGIIRYLLDAVAKMYDIESQKKSECGVRNISYSVQNDVLRTKGDFYLFTELRKNLTMAIDENPIIILDNPTNLNEKLGNLINAMGKTFHDILISGNAEDPFSGRSERKVFSIAISNPEQVEKEVWDVLNHGVRLGFLHEAFIGNKEGNGRTNLFVLNRCFAPVFTLDPTGFQGYLFMNNQDLLRAIKNGKKLREVGTEIDDDLKQMSFDQLGEW